MPTNKKNPITRTGKPDKQNEVGNLNIRQENFCKEYVKANGKSATQCAIAVGYSAKTAGQMANQLLGDTRCKEYIRKLKDEAWKDNICSIDEIYSLMSDMARGNIKEEVAFVVQSGIVSNIEKIELNTKPKDRIAAAKILIESHIKIESQLNSVASKPLTDLTSCIRASESTDIEPLNAEEEAEDV